ncbi:MAG: hypothetical protein HYZ28_06700 [Myxococcales bacterium]|nr:hypothetical protein [Myxococcales bacterium]
MRLAGPALAFLLLGCTRALVPERADDLAGFKAKVIASSFRLLVEGAVEGRSADVLLEVASPLTTVSTGCFDSLPSSDTTVRVPRPAGGFEEMPEVVLRSPRLGPLRLGERRAGLVDDGGRCLLTLGSEVLSSYAIHADPARRELSLSRPATREEYLAAASSQGTRRSPEEVHLLELSRDPKADWPMLAIRLSQGEQQLTGPFVLSTGEAHSSLSDALAAESGFRAGLELFEGIDLTELTRLHEGLAFTGYGMDSLELAPGLGLSRAVLRRDTSWERRGVLGALGGDVWGRFHLTIDLKAGLLVLRRPRVLASGSRQRCGAGEEGKHSFEACFVLHAFREREGLTAVGAIWRDLPEGGRLYLEPLEADGRPKRTECRFGFSFAETDRGVSSLHRFPWPGLGKAIPSCALALAEVHSASMALFEEGAMAECPGNCAFVQHVPSGRTSCDCQPVLGQGSGPAELRFFQLFRRLLEQRKKQAPVEPEPADPR